MVLNLQSLQPATQRLSVRRHHLLTLSSLYSRVRVAFGVCRGWDFWVTFPLLSSVSFLSKQAICKPTHSSRQRQSRMHHSVCVKSVCVCVCMCVCVLYLYVLA